MTNNSWWYRFVLIFLNMWGTVVSSMTNNSWWYMLVLHCERSALLEFWIWSDTNLTDENLYLSLIACPRHSLSSSGLSKGSSELNPIKSNKYLHIQSLIYLLITMIPNICLTFNQLYLWITEQRFVMMPVSLCTQTGLHCLIIQVLNTRV